MIASAGHALPGALSALRLRPMVERDLAWATELELASYPADEAATPEGLQYRLRVAPELFYGVYEADALVGFIVSTTAPGDELEEETMSTHSPGGPSICIHSVVVAAKHRRRGIALAMVRAYVDAVVAEVRCSAARRMVLLAKTGLLGLYRKAGFEVLGPSKVVHGADQWFDMGLDLTEKRKLDFMQVDAFTSVPLCGNPAAVLFTHRGGDEHWMQAVANENNLAETAFLERREGGGEDSEWDIRWFTPVAEVALCGHATLASAHALWASGRVPGGTAIRFHTRKAGVLRCSSQGPWIQMDFPAQMATSEGLGRAEEFAKALCLKKADVLAIARGPVTTPDWLVEVSTASFAAMEPDLGAIARVRPLDRGLIVTCAGAGFDLTAEGPPAAKRPRILTCGGSSSKHSAAGSFDFLSRFFAPTVGVPEDPVTGSAHCILTPYWTKKLQRPDGAPLQALQASPRGGLLEVAFHAKEQRVDIRGQAVTVLTGRMEV
mmetsp:Transcript_47724/g.135703  ORF Transcript_47724/g.135703 Transcript_47724/m.135703 type:complete len:492 (-) Transcript_47724:118-1593(-)